MTEILHNFKPSGKLTFHAHYTETEAGIAPAVCQVESEADGLPGVYHVILTEDGEWVKVYDFAPEPVPVVEAEPVVTPEVTGPEPVAPVVEPVAEVAPVDPATEATAEPVVEPTQEASETL